MATRALFIDQEYFYENTEVDENVDWKVLQPVVWDCQEIYIQDILGTPLYSALKEEIIDNDGSLTTPRFLTLVNSYVVPCLLKYVMTEVQVSIRYRYRDQSVLKGRTDNADYVDFEEHKYLKDLYQSKAEKYAVKIQDYLIANSTTFPEYSQYTSSDQVRAQNQKATTSLFVKGIGRRGCDYPRC